MTYFIGNSDSVLSVRARAYRVWSWYVFSLWSDDTDMFMTDLIFYYCWLIVVFVGFWGFFVCFFLLRSIKNYFLTFVCPGDSIIRWYLWFRKFRHSFHICLYIDVAAPSCFLFIFFGSPWYIQCNNFVSGITYAVLSRLY